MTARPDLVFAYCSGMARFAMEPPLAPLPFVLDMVDVDSAKWSTLASQSRGARSWIYRREAGTLAAFERSASRRARATLVVNQREQDALLGVAPGATVHVLENGVDVSAFAPPGVASPEPAVMFCGVLDYYPNEEGVVWFAREVWPTVTAERQDARFLVVGANPTKRIKDLAARDPSIEVTGRVESVQPCLWKSAVSVSPLRFSRGLQNKALEALAAGLPVVATSLVVDGLPEPARPGCVAADTADAFATAILNLLRRSPEERRRRAAAADMKALTWEERLQPLEAMLRIASTKECAGRSMDPVCSQEAAAAASIVR
jgi:glycosyltransferase involved in cell wall biosynthesis